MKKPTNKFLIILIVILATAIGTGLFFVQKAINNEVIEGAGSAQNAVKAVTSIIHGGKVYRLKRNTDAVLVMGIDRSEDKSTNFEFEIEAYYNYDMADFIALLVFDHEAKTVTPFQVNRDTMCAVPWLGVNGIVGGHRTEQIALAHSYGTGKHDSCVNVRNAVSDFLYGVPVDNYMAFTMDAVPIINDLVGGVRVTLEDDIPSLGKEFVKGATVTLRGKEALGFVRTRDTRLLNSNLIRQNHQRIYLAAFAEAARNAVQGNEDLAVDVFKAVDRFMCTDLTVNDVSAMVNQLCEYTVLPVVSPDGELVMGERFAEFYVDDDSLWDCVRQTFCRA